MVSNYPKHVVVIPDGNRRWTREKGLNPWVGHREGIKKSQDILKEAEKLDIRYLSFWTLSIDNIKNRPQKETKFLFSLLNKYLKETIKKKEIYQKKVKINIIGFWERFLPKEVCRNIRKVIEATKNHDRFFLNLFLAYNGTDEIKEAINHIKNQAEKNPDLKITSDLIKQNLLTKDLPPVDYLIRTGGEPHLSAGFMMWDIANAQLYFTKTYFPDFGAAEFRKAIQEYQKRERRLGG
jgi:undecaprenyl diphosphate synthase